MAELPAPEAVLRNALGPDAVEVGIHAGRGGHSTGFLSRLAGILHGVPQQADRIVALQTFYMGDTVACRTLRIQLAASMVVATCAEITPSATRDPPVPLDPSPHRNTHPPR